MSCSCPSSRRRRCGNSAAPPQQAAEQRDWAGLPRGIVVDIFLKLDPREIMHGPEFACKEWRSAALEEPSLWRHVGTVNRWGWRHLDEDVEKAMKLVAVDRAAGQCETFEGDCDDDYLLNLVERAPSLKYLYISEHNSDCESAEAFVEALMKLPLLEELEVYFNYCIGDRDENLLGSICQACPHLKKLVLMFASTFDNDCNKDKYLKETIDGEIPLMPMLHTLELYGCDLQVQGLKAIFDSCPVLETLHIRGYFDECEMDKELRMKCASLKTMTVPRRISGATPNYCLLDTDSQDNSLE